MDAQKLNALQTFLMAHGSSLESLPKARANQLSKVYDAVEARKQRIQEAKQAASDSAITILSISADTGISRKTFYNNTFLKLYVEESISATEFGRSSETSKEIVGYREQIRELEKRIRLMSIRDVESLNLEHKIAELSRELIEKDSRIINLEKEYEKACEALREARSQIPSKRAEILPFKRD